jgi:hypothetical protein
MNAPTWPRSCLRSLDDEDVATEDIEAAWAVEIEKRARRVLSDRSEGLPRKDVRRRAEAELRKR